MKKSTAKAYSYIGNAKKSFSYFVAFLAIFLTMKVKKVYNGLIILSLCAKNKEIDFLCHANFTLWKKGNTNCLVLIKVKIYLTKIFKSPIC